MPIRMWVAAALCAAAVASTSAQDWEPPQRGSRDGVQIRVARDYYLPADQVATWPIVVIGGSATIDGRLDDDLVVIGGPVRIGPAAEVRGSVVSVGGEVRVADTAQVTGEIQEVSIFWPDVRFVLREWVWDLDHRWFAVLSLAATVFRFSLVMVTACLLALVAPRWIRSIEERVVEAPLAAGLLGLAAEMLVVPVLIVIVAGLVLTIVGIPLLALVPFAVLAFIVLWIGGVTAVTAQIGGGLRTRVRLGDASTVIDVAWGVTLLFLVTFVGNLLAFGPPLLWPLASVFGAAGFAIEYLAWTVGLGAALLAPLQGRWRVSPPPVPSTASANA